MTPCSLMVTRGLPASSGLPFGLPRTFSMTTTPMMRRSVAVGRPKMGSTLDMWVSYLFSGVVSDSDLDSCSARRAAERALSMAVCW